MSLESNEPNLPGVSHLKLGILARVGIQSIGDFKDRVESEEDFRNQYGYIWEKYLDETNLEAHFQSLKEVPAEVFR